MTKKSNLNSNEVSTQKPRSILFVCTGNICRSPMAENIFNNIELREKRGHSAKSAGIYAEQILEMTPNAKLALKKCKERCFHIKPTQFTPDFINQYDLIVCMTKRHQEEIGSYENVKTLDEFANCGDIVDPYGCDLVAYIVVAKQLQAALKILYEKL